MACSEHIVFEATKFIARLRLLCAVAFAIFAPNVWAACGNVWDVEALQNAQVDSIALFDRTGNPVEQVTTLHLRQLVEIKRSLSSAASINTRFWICDDPQPGAFAFSNGSGNVIVLQIGLLKFFQWNAERISGVMAHEIAHIALGHTKSSSRIERIENAIAILNAALLDTGSGVRRGGLSALNMDAAQLQTLFVYVFQQLTQEKEMAADEFGIRLMTTAGIDPRGAVAAHISFLRQFGNTSGGDFDAHPSTLARINKLNNYLASDEDAKTFVAQQDNLAQANARFVLIANRLLRSNDIPRFSRLVSGWTKEMPNSSIAWYYDGLSKSMSKAGHSLARRSFYRAVQLNPENEDARLKLCIALFLDALKLESAYCSRALKFTESREEYQKQTFQGTLFINANAEPFTTVIISKDKNGKKYITNAGVEDVQKRDLTVHNSFAN